MANPEPILGPRKTMFILVIVVGCFAVLWPRILYPLFVGNVKQQIQPNQFDKQTGCCDMIFETDINAITIMTEVCSHILQKQSGEIDDRTKLAFSSGKLPKDIITMCRQEVNATCGIDIATFLDQNVKLGKSYKQILEEVRSYNGSNCLKSNFGVPTWALGGGGHVVANSWVVPPNFESIKQERPLHLRAGTPHPAIRERGRAIVTDAHAAPPRAAPPQRADGRVGIISPLSVYFEIQKEPIPIPGVRPPMGGAGGVVPPPKSSMGFFMPVYTICIVVFFMYTLCKILFRKTSSEQASPYEEIKPDPLFRRRVFDDGRSSERSTPETRLVVNAISGLVAEVRQQMEETYNQSNQTNNIQEPITNHNHANGNVHSPRHEQTPVRIIAQELPLPHKEAPREVTPEAKESTLEPSESTPEPKEPTPEPKEVILASNESAPEPEVKSEKLQSNEDKESLLNVQKAIETTATIQDIKRETKGKSHEQESEEELSEEEIEYDDEEEVEEVPAVKQFRGSVERENATVKVLGMEMTAHCESGTKWGDSAGAVPTPPPVKKLPPPPSEVSSIYLEGSLPHQSRLLVTDSETHREDLSTQNKDSPIVLSGKMTLSLINDESIKASPERDSDGLDVADDDDFTTASATTAPKQALQNEERDASEEEEDLDELIDDILRSDDEALKSDDEIFKSDDEVLQEDKDKSQKVTDISEISNKSTKINETLKSDDEISKNNEIKKKADELPENDIAESSNEVINTIDEIPETEEIECSNETNLILEEPENVEENKVDNEEPKPAEIFISVYEMPKAEIDISTTNEEVNEHIGEVLKSEDEFSENNDQIIKSVEGIQEDDIELPVNKDDVTVINNDEVSGNEAKVFISVFEMPKYETETSVNKDEVKESLGETQQLDSESLVIKNEEPKSDEDISNIDVEVSKSEDEIIQSLDKVQKDDIDISTDKDDIKLVNDDKVCTTEAEVFISVIEVPKDETETSVNKDEVKESVGEVQKLESESSVNEKDEQKSNEDISTINVEVTKTEDENIQSLDKVQKDDIDISTSKDNVKLISDDEVSTTEAEVFISVYKIPKNQDVTESDNKVENIEEIPEVSTEKSENIDKTKEHVEEKTESNLDPSTNIIEISQTENEAPNNTELFITTYEMPNTEMEVTENKEETTEYVDDILKSNAQVAKTEDDTIKTIDEGGADKELSANKKEALKFFDDILKSDIEITEIIKPVNDKQEPDLEILASKDDIKNIDLTDNKDKLIKTVDEVQITDIEIPITMDKELKSVDSKSDVELAKEEDEIITPINDEQKSANNDEQLKTVDDVSKSDVEVLQGTSEPSIPKTDNNDLLQNDAETVIDTIETKEATNENKKAESEIFKSDDEFVKVNKEDTSVELLQCDDNILTTDVESPQNTDNESKEANDVVKKDKSENDYTTEEVHPDNEIYEEIIHIGDREGKNTEVVLLPDGKIILPDGTVLESDPELIRDGYEVLGLNDMVYVVDFDVDGNQVTEDDDDILEDMEMLRNHPDVVKSVDDILASAAQVVESRNQMFQLNNNINEILEDDNANLSADDINKDSIIVDDTSKNADVSKPVHEQAKVSEVVLGTNEEISKFGETEVKPNPVVVLQATEMEVNGIFN